VTFTNKAADEMRERIEQLAGTGRAWVSTFHSLCASMLRFSAEQVGLSRDFTIYDRDDQLAAVAEALKLLEFDREQLQPASVLQAISNAKTRLESPKQFEKRTANWRDERLAAVYAKYQEILDRNAALDFDDLLMRVALLLQGHPAFRERWQKRFQYVLIDEYQDTNHAQYVIARQLSLDYPNLCVVGDPDQSIYKFRGSDIRNILDFERDFSQARVLTLSLNYRSTKSILRAASHLIAHNQQRKPKDLVTDNPEGQPVTVLTYETGTHEADGMSRRIQAAVASGQRSYRDFAVFLRINALSRAVEQAFIARRIPYQIVRGLAFFERKENRDILAYLRLLVNPRDDLSFLRSVNEPSRGIGKTSLEHLRSYAEPRELSLLAAAEQVQHISQIKGRAASGLRDFAALLRDLQPLLEAAPDEVIRQILDRSGYRQMLRDSRNEEDEERLANIEELITAARQFAAEDGGRTIADFLENITLASDVDGWDERQDSVSVMTLHAAKGLEFPVVFIAAVEQGILPHERSLSRDEEVEEERRLAFVGITRAKQECYLSHARLREFRGSTLYAIPSSFLDELPAQAIDRCDLSANAGSQRALDEWRSGGGAAEVGWQEAGFRSNLQIPPAPVSTTEPADGLAEGVFVRHPTFGDGRITSVSGHGARRRVKVRFRKAGEKTLVVQHARLTILPRA
jgi:DNA helicase-2/ATP-dependent DNA helicase PcrA